MKLYIQVENGQAVNHPAFEDNLIEAFGVIPDNWEPFTRVPNPAASDNTLVLNSPEPTYQKIDGVWTDVWSFRSKTAEELAVEKEARLTALRSAWASRLYANNFTAWVLNTETEQYSAPVPRPDDGKFYRWSGPDNNWKEADPIPQDGKQYYFDFDNWVNVEITNV